MPDRKRSARTPRRLAEYKRKRNFGKTAEPRGKDVPQLPGAITEGGLSAGIEPCDEPLPSRGREQPALGEDKDPIDGAEVAAEFFHPADLFV